MVGLGRIKSLLFSGQLESHLQQLSASLLLVLVTQSLVQATCNNLWFISLPLAWPSQTYPPHWEVSRTVLSLNETFPKDPGSTGHCYLPHPSLTPFLGGCRLASLLWQKGIYSYSSGVLLCSCFVSVMAPHHNSQRLLQEEPTETQDTERSIDPGTRLFGFKSCLPFSTCMALASHLPFFGFSFLICKMKITVIYRSHRLVMVTRPDTCELFRKVHGTWQRRYTLVIILLSLHQSLISTSMCVLIGLHCTFSASSYSSSMLLTQIWVSNYLTLTLDGYAGNSNKQGNDVV